MTDSGGVTVEGWLVARIPKPRPAEGDVLSVLGDLDWIPASVPGAVHYDLLAAGRLANPFAGTAAAQSALWVADSDWVYRAGFDAPDSAAEAVELEFAGVDTFSTVYVNGERVGTTANAYRPHVLRIQADRLRDRGNDLVVHVRGHHGAIADDLVAARERLAVQDRSDARLTKSLIRRYQRNSYSNSSLLNLGVHVLGIGLNGPVLVRPVPEVRIEDVHAVIVGLDVQHADVAVEVELGRERGCGDGSDVVVHIDLTDPETGATWGTSCDLADGDRAARTRLRVPDPQLWWPRGYGRPHLYDLEVTLERGGAVRQRVRQQVGLRTVELVRADADGRATFHLRVNGERIHVRGTNYVPVDYLKVHGAAEQYDTVFRLIEHGGHNLVRIWGGGARENSDFFDRCDELGILVWQDVFLHSNTYPEYDPAFVVEFEAETTELVRHVRSHPSLAVLCGGNEQWEGWEEWNWQGDVDAFYGAALSRDIAGTIAEKLCPQVPFVVNSPHGGPRAQSPLEGDTHTWGNFVNAGNDPQFVTETCWTQESYSRPETLREHMGLDVDTLTGRGWHRRWTELTGRPMLTKFPYSAHNEMDSLRSYLHSLEIEQAVADHKALSMLRSRSSDCSGIVYWSFNKGGPLFQFGAVDYGLRPMMSHYVVRRLFQDLVVTAYRDIDDVRVVVSNVSPRDVEGELRLRHLRTGGEVLHEQTVPVRLPAGGITRALDVAGLYRRVGNRAGEVVHAELTVDGAVRAEDTLFFCQLADVEPGTGYLRCEFERDEAGRVVLHFDPTSVATLVEIEADRRFLASDDYFPLVPGRRRTVVLEPLEPFDGATVTVTALGRPGIEEFRL